MDQNMNDLLASLKPFFRRVFVEILKSKEDTKEMPETMKNHI